MKNINIAEIILERLMMNEHGIINFPEKDTVIKAMIEFSNVEKSGNKKYKTIVIDPPWEYGVWGKGSNKCKSPLTKSNVSKPLPYKTMSIEEIKELPIKKISQENCELYLWATQKYLYDAIAIMKHWGFKYCTTITWCKKPMGTGQGGVYTPTTEFLIHGRIGKMPKIKRIDSTWFLTKRENNAHSRKPEFFQDLIETVTDEPRLEMFARRNRKGWDVWGDEVEDSVKLETSDSIA